MPPATSSRSDLERVRAPLATANGLPNAHYVDEATYEEEKQAVLFANWSGLATASDVPNSGDAIPLDFAGMPLLLLRDKSGAVRVFQNTCRHRGMILVSEPRNIEGAIRCPYHSWCYSTKGALVSTPHVGGPGQNTHDAIVREDLGLVEIRSHIWMDIVWINISGTAPDFEIVHADLLARWQEFDQPLFHGGAGSTITLPLKANWKLAIENYCESYHLPWVHPGLNVISKLEDHYHIENYGHFSGQGTYVYQQLTGDAGQTFPDFPGLSDKWDQGGEYIAVYPNVLLGVQRDHTFVFILETQSTEKTVEHIHIYYAASDVDPALKAKNAAQWAAVFDEDVFVVEGMQKGRHAMHFDGGRFSPAMDGPTHCFHDWIAANMQSHRDSTQI